MNVYPKFDWICLYKNTFNRKKCILQLILNSEYDLLNSHSLKLSENSMSCACKNIYIFFLISEEPALNIFEIWKFCGLKSKSWKLFALPTLFVKIVVLMVLLPFFIYCSYFILIPQQLIRLNYDLSLTTCARCLTRL